MTRPVCIALWGVRDPATSARCLRSALAFSASSVALEPDRRSLRPRRCAPRWERSPDPRGARRQRGAAAVGRRRVGAAAATAARPLQDATSSGPSGPAWRRIVVEASDGVAHIADRGRLAQRRHGGHDRALPDQLRSRRHDRARSTSCGRGGGATIASAGSTAALELRVHYLGRKAELPTCCAASPAAARGARTVGRAANQARQALEGLIEARAGELERAGSTPAGRRPRRRHLPGERGPSAPASAHGHLARLERLHRPGLHRSTKAAIVHYNFDALNHSPTPPARDRSDTFYIRPPGGGSSLTTRRMPRSAPLGCRLRTHTSPMQIRAWRPVRAAVRRHPRRAYRGDQIDATHSPMFHQVEGLAVDEDITLADLKGTLLAFAGAIFGEDHEVRLRRFFPFTDPGRGRRLVLSVLRQELHADGSRCSICRAARAGSSPRRRRGRPERLRLRRRRPLRRREVQGLARRGWASSASRCSSTA